MRDVVKLDISLGDVKIWQNYPWVPFFCFLFLNVAQNRFFAGYCGIADEGVRSLCEQLGGRNSNFSRFELNLGAISSFFNWMKILISPTKIENNSITDAGFEKLLETESALLSVDLSSSVNAFLFYLLFLNSHFM